MHSNLNYLGELLKKAEKSPAIAKQIASGVDWQQLQPMINAVLDYDQYSEKPLLVQAPEHMKETGVEKSTRLELLGYAMDALNEADKP